MKKYFQRKALERGFTLIELMIVIVILGVLMGTILPRLTGAQARARDTGRMADLQAISQALETYYDDFGKYPGTMGTTACLDETVADSPGALIASYLKGEKIPRPPSLEQLTTLPGQTTGCVGKYVYAPLINRGLANNGYILATDIETYQKANADIASAAPAPAFPSYTATSKVGDYSALITDDLVKLKAADNTATNTIFMIVN